MYNVSGFFLEKNAVTLQLNESASSLLFFACTFSISHFFLECCNIKPRNETIRMATECQFGQYNTWKETKQNIVDKLEHLPSECLHKYNSYK